MKRRRFRIRMWLIFAVTTASLAVTSTASAVRNAADGSGALAPQPAPVTSTSSSFDWFDGALAAAVIAVVCCLGLAYLLLARNRSHSSIATSH